MSDADYPIGYTATLAAPQQPQMLSASVTIGVNLREIAIEAARAAQMNIHDVTVDMGRDASDEAAYFFNFRIPQGEQVTGTTRSKLLGELRDRMLARSIAEYPYVKLTSS